MLESVNPYSLEKVYEVKELNLEQVTEIIDKAQVAFNSWKEVSFSKRKELMLAAGNELRNNKQQYALDITQEMGKPISQAMTEVEKCAWICEYYAEHSEGHLKDRYIETEVYKTYVRHDPIGIVLAIMPWNYPLWQVFRFAVPALMAGNVGLLKHAGNVMKSAENIEKIFKIAGFPEGCFTNLPISISMVENVIRNKKVKAVTLTGSEKAGKAVASIAGSEIKKSVLELGGSNALVVFDDCNLDKTIEICVQSRFQNAGQSCIAGKRLLVQASIADQFTRKFVEAVKMLKSGNPLEKDTYVGPMARLDLAEGLESQLNESVKKGAHIFTGGKRNNAYFEPTVLSDVTSDMSIFTEETFGPVIGITTFENKEEAVRLVNSSRFGLGVSVFTENLKMAQELVPQFEDGAVFINELVKSDPRLPFGGTKLSGYGRELSIEGIQEFVNKKTVYINKLL